MAAILAADMATASMVSMIPVIVAGGIVYKFTENMMPSKGQNIQNISKKKKKDVYNRESTGDFSNVRF